MKAYLLSLGAGVLVGVIYSLLGVRSPAPPVIALVGLLGILIGEQLIPLGKQLPSGTALSAAWRQSDCSRHLFGSLPDLQAPETTASRKNSGDTIMTAPATAPDLILHRGLFTTLDRANPTASAVAITEGKFTAVGRDHEVIPLAGERTRIIDLKGKRVLPGLIDNHLHIIRGGLNFNMELRWDGVRSLADAMAMLKHQVEITPPPQWVRVVGGFTEHQFAEKRLPTLDEINAVAPETPVFILHLYDRALLNKAALRAVGYTAETPVPPGGELVLDSYDNPTGLLLAKPNAGILYAALAKGPKLPFEYQVNSTRHFMRELNRLGVTGAIDAGGGFQNYPEDYAVIEKLAAEGQLTVRIAYNLFTQKPKGEKDDFLNWTRNSKFKQGSDYFRHNGGGEMLVFSAADFEDFRQPRPDMPPEMEGELEAVVRILAENRWPWRLHATYDETISRALDAFERVNQEIPLDGLNWFSTTPKRFRTGRSNASRRSAAASPCSTAWPIRANISSNAMASGPPKRRRRSPRSSPAGSKSRPVPTPPASPPTIRGCRSPGSSPERRSAACISIRGATAWTAKRRCGCGPRTSPGFRTRKGRKAASRSASWPTSSSRTATILPAQRTRSPASRLT